MKISVLFILLFTGMLQALDDMQQAIAVLYQNSQKQDKVRQIFQAAIDQYLGDDSDMELSVDDVIEHFLDRSVSVPFDVEFDDYQDFKEWVKKQKKTLLFLYESGDIACSVIHEHLRQLYEQNITTTLAQTVMFVFIYNVVGGIDEFQVRDVIPQVLLIEEGHIHQFAFNEMLLNLRQIINDFVK